jgi:hypothetical protein
MANPTPSATEAARESGAFQPKPATTVATSVPSGIAADPMLVGITEAMVAAHPELANVRNLYVNGDYAGALNALFGTDFYKNTSATTLSNQELKLNQPGVYEDTIKNTWLPALKNYVTQQGLQVSDADLEKIARKQFDLGLTPTAAATLALFRPTPDGKPSPYVTNIIGGAASTTRSNLQALNADYGTGFNQSWMDTAAESVASGATTEQYWTDQMKTQAAGAFPAWAEQIKAGQTMKQIASPYINTYANILGVDAASVTLNDNLLKQGLQGTDPTKPGAMPLWEFEKAVRKDPRWATSKDAMDSLSNTGATILRQWGLMS